MAETLTPLTDEELRELAEYREILRPKFPDDAPIDRALATIAAYRERVAELEKGRTAALDVALSRMIERDDLAARLALAEKVIAVAAESNELSPYKSQFWDVRGELARVLTAYKSKPDGERG